MFCENCGTKLPDRAKFCAKCGSKQVLPDEQTSIDNNHNKPDLVPATCTNCGQQLTVDPNQQAAVCPSCHSAYIVEQAIKNYNDKLTDNINTKNEGSYEQHQKEQITRPKNNEPQRTISFEPTKQTKGYRKVIKYAIFAFFLLAFLSAIFGSPSKKQDNTPQTGQTQQVQPGQQNADKKATSRKNLGDANAFWKSMADEMATKKESGYSFRKGVDGLLSKKNSSYEIFHKDGGEAHQIYIHGDFSSDNKSLEKVHVYLLPLQVTNDYSYYGFMGACLVTVRVTSPDLSNKDAQELLKKLQVITDKPKAGKYKVVHNDVEYTFENKIDEKSNDGFEFTAEIVNPMMSKWMNHDNSYSSVVDNAGLMTPDEQKSLLTLLQDIEKKHGIRCVVMTVKSTQGKSMKEFTNDVQDNYYYKSEVGSILLVVDIDQRKWHITTDSRMRKIITDDMVVGELKDSFINDLKKSSYSNAFSAYGKKVDQLITNYKK